MTNKTTGDRAMVIGVVVILLVIAVVLFLTGNSEPSLNVTDTASTEASGANLALAECITDSGAVFYGAFWCSHCQAQKTLFEAAAPALPYVECSTPDQSNQTQVCKDKGITGYPTWIFADGTQLSGELSFATLAEKTDCSAFLPDQAAATTGVLAPSSL